jgi:hypothetical protein
MAYVAAVPVPRRTSHTVPRPPMFHGILCTLLPSVPRAPWWRRDPLRLAGAQPPAGCLSPPMLPGLLSRSERGLVLLAMPSCQPAEASLALKVPSTIHCIPMLNISRPAELAQGVASMVDARSGQTVMSLRGHTDNIRCGSGVLLARHPRMTSEVLVCNPCLSAICGPTISLRPLARTRRPPHVVPPQPSPTPKKSFPHCGSTTIGRAQGARAGARGPPAAVRQR